MHYYTFCAIRKVKFVVQKWKVCCTRYFTMYNSYSSSTAHPSIKNHYDTLLLVWLSIFFYPVPSRSLHSHLQITYFFLSCLSPSVLWSTELSTLVYSFCHNMLHNILIRYPHMSQPFQSFAAYTEYDVYYTGDTTLHCVTFHIPMLDYCIPG